MPDLSNRGEWTQNTDPAETARILLARVPGVSKVEAETILVTFVCTTISSVFADRETIYELEKELMAAFPGTHFDFSVKFE